MNRLLLIAVFITGCASQGIDRAEQNIITKEFYASIQSVKQVELSSSVKEGIAGGAMIGFIDEMDGNHEDMIAGGIAGAIVGGIFTALFEGSNKAYEYALNSENEGDFTLVQKELVESDSKCVKVRVSKNVSISAVAAENCRVK